MSYLFKGIRFMDAEALAHEVRSLRKKKEGEDGKEGRTLQEVADLLVEKGYAKSLSSEMIRRAEDPSIITGSKLFELRVAIIEALGGRQLSGPLWVYRDELTGEAAG